MSDTALLRIGILTAGLLLIAAILLFGRPRKKAQGRRIDGEPGTEGPQRREPSLGGTRAEDDTADDANAMQATAEGDGAEPGMSDVERNANSDLGKRASQDFDKIVSLFVAARAGEVLRGEDIVVAAEKTGLVFGHMNVFHRLVEGHPERGPIFSMASIMKPGSFDMATIRQLETPAIAFFLTLPAPLTALDSWEKMLPTVQRMAELLDAVVLDDSRNALGRQRIAHIRDDLRAYDRQHQAPPLTRTPRW